MAMESCPLACQSWQASTSLQKMFPVLDDVPHNDVAELAVKGCSSVFRLNDDTADGPNYLE